MAANLPNLRLVDAARAAEALLLAVVVILHAASWFALDYLKPLGTAGSLLAEALPFASLSLLALWIPLGPGPLWLRGAASPLLAWLLYQATWSRGPTDWTSADQLLAIVAAALFATALVLRLCGVRMMSASPRLDTKAPQFSVRSLLIVTTLVALCVGGLEAARPWLKSATDVRDSGVFLDRLLYDAAAEVKAEDGKWSEWLLLRLRSFGLWMVLEGRPRQALMSAIFVVASLLAAWAVLRPGTVGLRLAGAAVCIPAAGIYLGQLTSLDHESTLTMTVWTATIGLIVALSVAPLRLLGYRVLRPRIAATSGRAGSAAIPGSAGASPSQAAPSEHKFAESHS